MINLKCCQICAQRLEEKNSDVRLRNRHECDVVDILNGK